MTEVLLYGRTALITGATRGIGQAVARSLSEAGAELTLSGRDPDRLRDICDDTDGRALPFDLRNADEVARVLGAHVAAHGPPDVLVHAAGVFDLAPLAETSMATFDLNLDVNLRGAFAVTRAVLPAMLGRGSGRIVNVGSVSGRRAFPSNGAYAASKFGLRGLHEVLVEELRGTGVSATLIEPGAVDTAIWDRVDPDTDPTLPARAAMLRPEDVAEVVRFACARPPHVGVPLIQVERG